MSASVKLTSHKLSRLDKKTEYSVSFNNNNYYFRCSAFESEIERLRINKKVRICGDCFAKLSFRTK